MMSYFSTVYLQYHKVESVTMQSYLVILLLVCVSVTFGHQYPKYKHYRGNAGFERNAAVIDGVRGYGQFDIGTGPNSFQRREVYRGPNFIGNPRYFNEFSNIPYVGINKDVGDYYGYGVDGSSDRLYRPYGRLGGDSYGFGVDGSYGRLYRPYGRFGGDRFNYDVDGSSAPYGRLYRPDGRLGGFDNVEINEGYFGGIKPILGKYKKY